MVGPWVHAGFPHVVDERNFEAGTVLNFGSLERIHPHKYSMRQRGKSYEAHHTLLFGHGVLSFFGHRLADAELWVLVDA